MAPMLLEDEEAASDYLSGALSRLVPASFNHSLWILDSVLRHLADVGSVQDILPVLQNKAEVVGALPINFGHGECFGCARCENMNRQKVLAPWAIAHWQGVELHQS